MTYQTKRKLKKTLGWFFLASPFLALAVFLFNVVGLLAVLAVAGTTLAAVFVMKVGIDLVHE